MQTIAKPTQLKLIQPTGNVHAANAVDFQEHLHHSVSTQDHLVFVVDMSFVEFLDSAGLMALVSSRSLAQRLGKRFILCSLQPTIKMILELTQLDQIFEIQEERPEPWMLQQA